MSPRPGGDAARLALREARDKLAKTTLSEPSFVLHMRRVAEAKLWATIVVSNVGPAIRLLCARRGRMIIVGTTPADRLTRAQRDVLDTFGNVDAVEIFAVTPNDIDRLDEVFD